MHEEDKMNEERKRRRPALPPLLKSSRMSLISLTGKVRLRLRSASLTAICHSTCFHFTCTPLPSCSGTGLVSTWLRSGANRMS